MVLNDAIDPDDNESQIVLIFLTYVLGGEIAACCAIYLELNLAYAIVLGLGVLGVIHLMFCLLNTIAERNKAQLNAKEKEGEA